MRDPMTRDEFDRKVDDATHAALAAFGLHADDMFGDELNSAIESVMRKSVELTDSTDD